MSQRSDVTSRMRARMQNRMCTEVDDLCRVYGYRRAGSFWSRWCGVVPDFDQFLVEPEPSVRAEVGYFVRPRTQTDIARWFGYIDGSPLSAWRGQRLAIEIDYPDAYPVACPTVRFTDWPPPFHPNICPSTGTVCFEWTPVYRVSSLMVALRDLLSDPCTDDDYDGGVRAPLNAAADRLFVADRVRYDEIVRWSAPANHKYLLRLLVVVRALCLLPTAPFNAHRAYDGRPSVMSGQTFFLHVLPYVVPVDNNDDDEACGEPTPIRPSTRILQCIYAFGIHRDNLMERLDRWATVNALLTEIQHGSL